MEKIEKVKLSDFLKTIVKVFKFGINVDKKRLPLIVFTVLINSILVALSAYFLSIFLNNAVYFNEGIFLSKNNILILVSVVIFNILNSIISLWNFRIKLIFSRKFFTETYIAISNAYANIDIQTYESVGFETKKTKVQMFLSKFQGFIDRGIDCISNLIPMIISLIIIVSVKKYWLLLVVIVPAIINFYIEILDGETIWKSEDIVSEDRKRFWAYFGFFGLKNHIEEIKIHGLKNFFIKNLKISRDIIEQVFGKRDITYANKKLIASIITNISEIIIPLVLIHEIFTKKLLIGAFWFINSRISAFNSNFRTSILTLSAMYKDSFYVIDILKILETKEAIPNGTEKLKSFEKLEIKNLSFTYPESDRLILKDLNLSITKGEKIAIIGLNGAGKTTLTKLLLRFYLPTIGSVEYNNIKTEGLEKVSFYENIGFLPQDFAKFDLTFRETIALGNIEKEIDDNKVIEAAKKAEIHDFIISHENGYKTQIGKKYKNGVEMSGGQWQKVALARLFYRNAPLWILDEPTSAIDAEAESLIFEQLEKLPNDITVIMISHRFSTVRNADRIIVIGDGTIIENGTHEQLLKLKGEYSRLFKLQAEGYK